jgi:hypothetical protein
MIYSGSGNIPRHLYCYVDRSFVRTGGIGFEPCVWFGLHSYPGRAWGCHVMLECGAVYRGVPPHAIAFSETPGPWSLALAQRWDCYGEQFSVLEYDFLAGLGVETNKGWIGKYLFTVVPLFDAYTAEPSQSKEFMFCQMNNGRLCILPTNHLLFQDLSFTRRQWPIDIRLNDSVWSSEL